jgi:hypothetical protein
MMRILPTFAATASLLVSAAAWAAEPSIEATQPAPAEAAQPAAPAESPASAEGAAPAEAAALAAEAAPADAPAPAAASAPGATPATLSPEDQRLVAGYKPEQRGEKTVYCRGEREPDSRMKVTRCYSLNQLRNAKKNN